MLLFFSAVILFLILFNRILGYVWLLALIGFYFKLQSSNNLWDYLYDPLLWLVLLTNCVSSLLSLQWRRKALTAE